MATLPPDDPVKGQLWIHKEERRKYLQGVLDAKTDSTVTGDGSKYQVDKHNCIQSVPTLE